MTGQRAETVERPRRRLHLAIDLAADDLDAVCGALLDIANDLMHGGREQAEHTSGGYSSSYHLTLTLTDPDMDHDTYERRFTAWAGSNVDSEA